MRRRVASLLVIAAAASLALGPARATAADAATNIARGRPYTLRPAPNYWLTTDADDARQLTDGSQTNWDPIWVKSSTVGWSNATHVTIVIDLQSVQPISGVSYSTAAGRADVQWPRSIFALVSDDGTTFYPIGDLARPSPGGGPPATGYATFRFALNNLAVHGRFVALIVDAVGQYTFCDEVEVLAGDQTALTTPPLGAATLNLDDYFVSAHQASALERRLRADLAGARRAVDLAAIDSALRTALAAELTDVEAGIAVQPGAAPPSFRAVLPLNPLHARIFAVHGAIARATGRTPLSAWPANPWDFVTPLDTPPDSGGLDEVAIAAMNGETRSGAISVRNATERAMQVTVAIDGLPLSVDSGELELFAALWTDTRELIAVSDALVPLGASLEVPSGMTRQLWLRVRPRQRAPGVYRGVVALTGADGWSARVPIEVHVLDGQFPERPALHVGGWDYTNAAGHLGLTPNNLDPVIATLRALAVDTPWATASAMPQGGFDSNGRMIAAPDTSQFDAWVDSWRGAARYALFLSAPDRIGTIPADDTPRFTAAVADWVHFWTSHASSIGVQPSQLMLLLVDEPHNSAQDDRIVRWARAIKAADPRVVLFEDPTYPDPVAARAGLFDTVDVLALERSLIVQYGAAFVDFYRDRHALGQELAVYGASGPARLVDPYSYQRLQAWLCADLGAASSFFWSFADDANGGAWNEYAIVNPPFSPLLLSDSEVTISKHSEAIREGTEDFEYLRRLGADPDRSAAMRAAIAAVLTVPGSSDLQWTSMKDRSAAERTRLAIAAALGLWNETPIVQTRIAATANPSTFAEPVTIDVMVSNVGAGATAPTGAVQVVDVDGAALGDATLADGHATMTVAALAVGEHRLTIDYAGDATHLASRVELRATIAKATPLIVAPPVAAVYDARRHAAAAAAAGRDGAAVAGTVTISYEPGGSIAPTDAGRYGVRVDFVSDDPNYTDATLDTLVAIAPAAPALMVVDVACDYDGRAHATTAAATGIDGAAAPGSISIVYAPGGDSPPSAPGRYGVTATFTSASANYANASATGSISIGPAPVTATLLYPAADAIDADLSLPLQWTAVFQAQAYYVYGGSTPGAKDLIDTGEIGATSYRVAVPPSGQTVYVRLWAKVGGVWRFADSHFRAAPLVATLASPAAGATNADLLQPLQWPAIPSAQAYYVWAGSTQGGRDLADSGEITQTVYRIASPPLQSRTIYIRLWTRVAGIWRYADSSFISTSIVATLSAPRDGSTVADNSPLLEWAPVAAAQAYCVYVGTNVGARDLGNSGEIAQTTYRVAPLGAGQAVFVRLWVRVAGVWRSTDATFTIAAP